MNKLVVAILGQDCENTIGMCLESVKDADTILYVDGGSKDDTIKIVREFGVKNKKTGGDLIIKEKKFNKKNPNAISEQRNFYLDYLKENHLGDVCLVIDADEVVDDLKPFLKWRKKHSDFIKSPQMRHLMYTLGFEDASQPFHSVPHRFFKITDDLYYPEGEHTVLSYRNERGEEPSLEGLIWHLAYLGGVWDVKKRYDQQVLRNSGHSKDFLNNWNKTHMLGNYLLGKVNPVELPDIILNNFGLDKDELYFEGRGLEHKHWIDAVHWKKFFKCKTAYEYGCGKGPRVYAMNNIGIDTVGYDISKYAVNNKLDFPIYQRNILDENSFLTRDLVIAYDLLEHIAYEDLDTAINTLIDSTKEHILVSIPFIGDPNLENDPTHIIKKTKEWWIKQFTNKGLKEVEVPEHFLFKEQLLIFEK